MPATATWIAVRVVGCSPRGSSGSPVRRRAPVVGRFGRGRQVRVVLHREGGRAEVRGRRGQPAHRHADRGGTGAVELVRDLPGRPRRRRDVVVERRGHPRHRRPRRRVHGPVDQPVHRGDERAGRELDVQHVPAQRVRPLGRQFVERREGRAQRQRGRVEAQQLVVHPPAAHAPSRVPRRGRRRRAGACAPARAARAPHFATPSPAAPAAARTGRAARRRHRPPRPRPSPAAPRTTPAGTARGSSRGIRPFPPRTRAVRSAASRPPRTSRRRTPAPRAGATRGRARRG